MKCLSSLLGSYFLRRGERPGENEFPEGLLCCNAEGRAGVQTAADCHSFSRLPLGRWFRNSAAELLAHRGIRSIKLSPSVLDEELVDNLP